MPVTDIPFTWARHYPDRWAQEVAALDSRGWTHRVEADPEDPVLSVLWPLPGSEPAPATNTAVEKPPTVELTIRFPAEYPFFPPHVTAEHDDLGLIRHRNPTSGDLCVTETADWHVNTTVAELLAVQMPRLLAAGRSTDPPPQGAEVPSAEPVSTFLDYAPLPALVIPDHEPIPADVHAGAMIVRYGVPRPNALGPGLVERLLGPGVDIAAPESLVRAASGRLTTYGRWLRDPEFDPTVSAQETYERIRERLEPLAIETDHPHDIGEGGDGGSGARRCELPPEELETIALRVPSETGYRSMGEEWIAILKADFTDDTQCKYLPVQALGGPAARARSPQTAQLCHRHVVLVGLGAIGHHLAFSLARAGVGRLDLIDADRVDVTTASRQPAPWFAAGLPKVVSIAADAAANNPHTDIQGFPIRIGAATGGEARGRIRRRAAAVLADADLVIDATANPAATRYLAAVRQARGGAFLHVSATAGAWAGCVQLTTPHTGCWACLELLRAEGRVPVPNADPAGLIAPAGCADTTFTGTNADLATIAEHAARVAIDQLAGGPGLGADLYVAQLRNVDGDPLPAMWIPVPVPVHPDCPLHATPQEAQTPIAPGGNDRTVKKRPGERQADGSSPPGAPIPRTQQRKQDIPNASGVGAAETHSGCEGGERASPRVSVPDTAQAAGALSGTRPRDG